MSVPMIFDRGTAGQTRGHLLARIATVLACPKCQGPLDPEPGGGELQIVCPRCGAEARRCGNQYVMGGFTSEKGNVDWLNMLKERAKRRLGGLYPLAIRVLAPVHLRGFVRPFLRSFNLDQMLVADLGSGTTSYGERVVCVDGGSYPSVHVVAELANLPFRGGTLDGLISIAVLEHVAQPAEHVREMLRVLRPGGRVLCYTPFIQGFHASPHDYQRYTIQGLRRLFVDFEVLEVSVGAGPTSGMLWILQEWLALLLSCGSVRLHRLLLPVTWVLSPLKFLDVFLARHPAAHVIASGYYIISRKPT